MNSVALPASASTQVLNAEADLVRLAARGDSDAFGELYRRHSGPAWRLAQAVTPDKDAAVASFRDGFVKAVRAGRLGRRATTGMAFRPHLLSSVYKSAIDQAYDRGGAPAAVRRAVKHDPDAALADAAFRSLPERWRAAVWLSDVENFDLDRLSAVLGVSTAVAEQLVSRGRRGLAGRFAQAHREAPEHIGETLRPLALAVPANLADLASTRFVASGSDRLPMFAPITQWMEERAIRPMSVAVGALIGLGLIGLGVVPTNGTVRSQFGATGTSSVNGSVPVHTCFGLACPGGTAGGGTIGLTAANGAHSPSLLASAFTGVSSAGKALSNALDAAQPGSGVSGSSGTGSGPGSGTSPSSPGTPATPGTPGTPGGSGVTTVTVPGVATVTVAGTGASLNLLSGTVRATICSSGATVSAGSASVGTCNTSSSTPPTSSLTTTVTGTIKSVTKVLSTTAPSGVSSTVQNTTGAVDNTVTDTTTAVKKLTSGL